MDHNIDQEPLFVDPENHDFQLQAGSPCIDAGNNAALPEDTCDLDDDGDITEEIPCDLDGDDRRMDDPDTADTGLGPAPVVDMGAYEYHDKVLTWLGYSNDWNDCHNWQPDMVPALFNHVLISELPTERVWPYVSEFNCVAGKILIEFGSLTIDQGELTVGGY